MTTSLPISIITAILAGISVTLMVLAIFATLRSQTSKLAFPWALAATASCAMLTVAAVLYTGKQEGLLAAMLQLLTVFFAFLLWSLCLPVAEENGTSRSLLPVAGRGFAWFTLIGLPPTVGFHSKVMLNQLFISAGWLWAVVLSLTCSALLLLPMIFSIRSGFPSRCNGIRSFIIVILIGVTTILGLYPQPFFAQANAFLNLLSSK